MMNNILVATDFSASADRALDAAIELARRDGGRIELMHVLESGTFVLPPPLDIVTVPLGSREITRHEHALVERAGRVSSAGLAVNTRIESGVAAQEIVKTAKDVGADLIVVGSHGAGFLATVLVGSVAARVIRHAPCPVLVVPKPL